MTIGFSLFDSWSEACREYMHGACHVLTFALNYLTGWKCMTLNDEGFPIHSFVQTPSGTCIDANGVVTIENMKKRYGTPDATVEVSSPQILAGLYGIDPEDDMDMEFRDALLYAKKLLNRKGVARWARRDGCRI